MKHVRKCSSLQTGIEQIVNIDHENSYWMFYLKIIYVTKVTLDRFKPTALVPQSIHERTSFSNITLRRRHQSSASPVSDVVWEGDDVETIIGGQHIKNGV